MPSIFDALLNPEGDDKERAKATIAALKRQQLLGQVGQLMGVEPTVRAGESMIRGAQSGFGDALQAQAQARAAAAAQRGSPRRSGTTRRWRIAVLRGSMRKG